jgi:hypothetical protein
MAEVFQKVRALFNKLMSLFRELTDSLYQSFRILSDVERSLFAFDLRDVVALEDCSNFGKGTLIVFDNDLHCYIDAEYGIVLNNWMKIRPNYG